MEHRKPILAQVLGNSASRRPRNDLPEVHFAHEALANVRTKLVAARDAPLVQRRIRLLRVCAEKAFERCALAPRHQRAGSYSYYPCFGDR